MITSAAGRLAHRAGRRDVGGETHVQLAVVKILVSVRRP